MWGAMPAEFLALALSRLCTDTIGYSGEALKWIKIRIGAGAVSVSESEVRNGGCGTQANMGSDGADAGSVSESEVVGRWLTHLSEFSRQWPAIKS
jgi:hypothetical protein